MLTTQRPDEDTSDSPVRQVRVCIKVPNTIDDDGIAVKVELSCGHITILTGPHVGLEELPCRVCGLRLPVRHTRQRLR